MRLTAGSRALDDRAGRRWLLGFLRPRACGILVIIALSLAATSLALCQPYIMKLLIDQGLTARRFDRVLAFSGAFVLMTLAGALLGGVNRWVYISVSGRTLFALREALYRHLLGLSPDYHARIGGGELLARLDGDIGEVQRFAVDSLLALVNGLFALTGALALLIVLSGKLALLALVLLPGEFAYLRWIRPRLEASTRKLRERASELTNFFFETLPAIKLIQSVGAEAREALRLSRLQEAYLRDLLRSQVVGFAAATVPGLMMTLSTAAVFVGGGYLVIRGDLTLGSLIAFSAYFTRATGPVQTLLGVYVGSQRARVSLDRLMQLTSQAPAVVSPRHPTALPAQAAGEVRIEGVFFRYGSNEADVLRDLDAVIPAERKVGVVGTSGAGKTTVIDLLQRHYDPQSGRILLAGIDLRALDLGELRRRVAVVSQDTILFAASIADNIRYACPEADDAAIRRASELAEIDDFVSALPAGYQTVLGTRGATLSGGQRQRLAIARALLQRPLVLVLDEATSAVDRDTEARIGEAVDRLFADCTRIVVTHRHEALASASTVLELSGGRFHARLSPIPHAA